MIACFLYPAGFILFSIQTELSQIHRQVSLRSLTTLQKRLINEERWAAAQTCLRDFIPQTPFIASRYSSFLSRISIKNLARHPLKAAQKKETPVFIAKPESLLLVRPTRFEHAAFRAQGRSGFAPVSVLVLTQKNEASI